MFHQARNFGHGLTVGYLALLLLVLVPLPLPQAAGEEYEVLHDAYAYFPDHRLSNESRSNIYYLDVEQVTFFWERGAREVLFGARPKENGTINFFFIKGHTTSSEGYLENHSRPDNISAGPRTLVSYDMDGNDPGKYTILVTTQENFNESFSNLRYELVVRVILTEVGLLEKVAVVVVMMVALITVPALGWIYWKLPKYRKISTIFQHSPLERILSRKWESKKKGTNLKYAGELVPKETYLTSLGTRSTLCPGCMGQIGVLENHYKIHTIILKYRDPRPESISLNKGIEKRPHILHCEKCGRIFGIAREVKGKVYRK